MPENGRMYAQSCRPWYTYYIVTARKVHEGLQVTQLYYTTSTTLTFSMAEDPELSVEDRQLLRKIMKLDPSDRPTAR